MIINLISGPRNISTALMYSFAQRSDMAVLDEPFYGLYLDRYDVDHPSKAEVLSTFPTTLEGVLEWIEAEASHTAHLFVKNMGHHLKGLTWNYLTEWKNVFLIRDPKQLIASFAQVIENPTIQDIGLQDQAKVYEWLKEQGHDPLVIDSNRILEAPSSRLQSLCEKIGLPFQEGMLSWSPNAPVVDVPWAPYWYKNVQQSSGFIKQKTSSRPLPEHCVPLYESALPYYNLLHENAL